MLQKIVSNIAESIKSLKSNNEGVGVVEVILILVEKN